MTSSYNTFIQVLLFTALLSQVSPAARADSEHNHQEASHRATDNHQNELDIIDVRGPMNGKLLSDEDFAVEITLYASGIPPEMRIYSYYKGRPLSPQEVNIRVALTRLGGVEDDINFIAEQDYLLSTQSIAEPHSYDVTVTATFQDKHYRWQYDNHEGRTRISDRMIAMASIGTDTVGPQTLSFTDTLFGVIAPVQDRVSNIYAPYSSMVENVHVSVGDKVRKGQQLLTLKNIDTLQRYSINSPSHGEVTQRSVNRGDRAVDQQLLKITDLSQVWVEMSAFPENIEKLRKGQKVSVYDLHQHDTAIGTITYIAPQMSGGHIARARATISNPNGHWRPGMHIKADIEQQQHQVAMAVKASAVQHIRDMPVVFAKFGNIFEVRMIELAEPVSKSKNDYLEVIGGIAPGTEYVSENSFLLKADILKDGASHDH